MIAARGDRYETSVRNGSIGLTNVGLTPIKATAAEAALKDQRPDEATVRRAAQLAADASEPGEDLRGSVEYKKDMVRVLTGRALRNLGLDELSLSQSDDDTKSTIVRLGKQISRRWYVGYERGLNATTGSWQLIYRIAQRFTLRAQGGEDNALDLIWQWKWN